MAARYLISGGNGNWTSTTNWSATSGGASGASAPVAADDVTFDSNSGSQGITLDTSGRSCKSLTVTSGYTGTMTMTNVLNVAGSVTLGANMTIAGSGSMTISATSTMTSNGKTWPNSLFLTTNVTYTVADNWTVLGSLTVGSTSNTTNINTSTIYCAGSLTFNANSGTVAGNGNIVMNGTGTYSYSSVGSVSVNVEINTTGTITLGANIRRSGGILKFTAGTVIGSSTVLTLTNLSTVTVNMAGIQFASVSITAGNQTFNGTYGFTTGSWSQLVAGLTHIFTSGNTYTITGAFTVTATSASKCTMRASTTSSACYINHTGGIQALLYCTITDVDSSGGREMYVYQGTLTRTTNWVSGSIIAPATSKFFMT